MSADRKGATYEDLLAVPAHLVAQIVGGMLITQPRPAAPHARAASTLGIDLGGPFDRQRGGPGGWHILYEPELHLGGDILVPDLAGWRRERLPTIPRAAFFTLAPDWLCEVLSPSTAGIDRGVKLQAYARERVRHVWFVDPDARTQEVLSLDVGNYRIEAVHHGVERVRAVPFDAIELELAALWVD
ncbi:MAG: Uma2 family endonuclease [Polyangiaceae bacterium]